jgi:transposase
LEPVISAYTIDGTAINADKGYDSKDFVDWLESKGITPNIPSRKTNKKQRKYDKHQYKERHLIECFWQKIKQYRRVATRYEKLAKTFLGFVYLASVLILVK